MDNHVHMLLYANDIKQISNFMKNINSIYAMYYNKKQIELDTYLEIDLNQFL